MKTFFKKIKKHFISSLPYCIIILSSYFISNGSYIHVIKVTILFLLIDYVWYTIKKSKNVYAIQIKDKEKEYFYIEKEKKPTLTENLQEATVFKNKKRAIQKAYELGNLMKKDTFLVTVKLKEKD